MKLELPSSHCGINYLLELNSRHAKHNGILNLNISYSVIHSKVIKDVQLVNYMKKKKTLRI